MADRKANELKEMEERRKQRTEKVPEEEQAQLK